jgi:hypothetical protein
MNANRSVPTWILPLLAVVVGGILLVYALANLMFIKGSLLGIATKIALAGGVGGLVLGGIAGALDSPKAALPWLGLAASPLLGFGALLLPGLLEGHWLGVGIWWLGAVAVMAVGITSCWITHHIRRRP